MKTRILALLASIVVTSATHAELISYSFEGFVSTITYSEGEEFTPLNVLDPMTGNITFDLSVAPLFSNDSSIYWPDSAVAVSISVGDFIISLNNAPGGGGLTQALSPSAAGQSIFQTIQPIVSNMIDNFASVEFALVATDTDGVALADLGYPTSLEEFDFFEGLIVFANSNSDSAFVALDITSMEVIPVPLPGAFWLFITTVSLLGFKRPKPA